ncbi:MAG: DEAD/DEAH box helicase [Bacteroidia bacterium]|nr:DEAD/DEAH box helicase [Bacteroidia bacterium]
MESLLTPGRVVRFRRREWILLAREEDVVRLRPLVGDDTDTIEVPYSVVQLLRYELPEENIEAATFPLPHPTSIRDALSVRLIGAAARLLLRNSAAPFRSLSRISVEPRPYQLVPLLIALQQDPVRLFIADDVGVGKTIEALLIAQELWERGQIRRVVILCPPHLCDQWATEMQEKFAFSPAILRSGTYTRLERETPPGKTLYEHYHTLIASIDFVKTERNRHLFLQFLPDLLIVDEAHTATLSSQDQQRYTLLQEAVQKKPNLHLLLLSATPHSGIEQSFQSLMGLLHSDFFEWDYTQLTSEQERRLRQHFIQRTRKTLEETWSETLRFPTRLSETLYYNLTQEYLDLYRGVREFCQGWISSKEGLTEAQKRMRYWGALALLRSVMSSPAAASQSLSGKADALEEEPDFVLDSQALAPLPDEPVSVPSQESSLRRLSQKARDLTHAPEKDPKLTTALALLRQLLHEGFSPLVWCRYVATAEYVHTAAEKILKPDLPELAIACITGRIEEEQRRQIIAHLPTDKPRLLITTDCLSEGINLQDKFNAALHYDLPWNPNRLEQREGRIDRYGQLRNQVKAFLLLGRNNPLDGVVMEVLLEKAQRIRQTLGVMVPIPEEHSPELTQALMEAVLFRSEWSASAGQPSLSLHPSAIQRFHSRLEMWAQQEKVSRARFSETGAAQKALLEELMKATTTVLGSTEERESFLQHSLKLLACPLMPDRRLPQTYYMPPDSLLRLPLRLRNRLPDLGITEKKGWRCTFLSPLPPDSPPIPYIGRLHPFLQELSRFLLEEAFRSSEDAIIARIGALRTKGIATFTYLYLVRLRYQLQFRAGREQLAEEVLSWGFEWRGGQLHPLPSDTAENLWNLLPTANIPLSEKQELAKEALSFWETKAVPFSPLVEERMTYLSSLYGRLDLDHPPSLQVVGEPDLLALLVFQPQV